MAELIMEARLDPIRSMIELLKLQVQTYWSTEEFLALAFRIANDNGLPDFDNDVAVTTLQGIIGDIEWRHEPSQTAMRASLDESPPPQDMETVYGEVGLAVFRDLLVFLKNRQIRWPYHATLRRFAHQKRTMASLKALKESWDKLLSVINSREHELIDHARGSLRSTRLDDFTQAAIEALLDQKLLLAATQLIGTAQRYDAEAGAPSIPQKSLGGQVMARTNEALCRLLHFQTIPNREVTIAEARAQSCEWVFNGHDGGSTKLSSWLEHGNGLYLIVGNEGSGKSTLMKYIWKDAHTKKFLQTWSESGTSSIVKAAYFFWRSGTQLQRSEEGLLRALIYSVLEQRPEFTPRVLPREWATIFESLLHGNNESVPALTEWTVDNLRTSFKRLFGLPINIFILVDGLDEYQDSGDSTVAYIEMIRSLTNGLVGLQNVKMLASSRPLDCLETLEIRPNIDLHQWNHNAIRSYVLDTLTNDLDRNAAETNDELHGPKIIDYLLSTANGSFLWAELAVKTTQRQLLEGCALETIYEQRSTRLAAGMPGIYQQLWSNMKADQQKEASEILQIVLAGRSLNQSPSNFDGAMRLVDLTLAIGNPRRVANMAILPWSVDRIRADCRHAANGFTKLWPDFIKVNDEGDMISTRIEFCHRSVLEFLEHEETRMFSGLSRRSGFDPFISHLQSAVQHLKILPKLIHHNFLRLLWVFVTSALLAANKVDSRDSANNAHYKMLLTELDRTMQYHHGNACKDPEFQNRHFESRMQDPNGAVEWRDRGRDYERVANMHWSNFHYDQECSHPRAWNDSFLSLAVQFGLNKYVDQVLQEGSWIQMIKKGSRPKKIKIGRPLLNYALAPSPIAPHSLITPELVEILLAHGANLGEKFEGKSCWENALRWQYETFVEVGATTSRGSNSEERGLAENRAQIFLRLLRNGANTKVSIETSRGLRIPAKTVVEGSFKNLALGSTYEELQGFFR